MYIYDIIEKKRNGKELTKEEIEFVVKGFLDESISEAQMSAWLMAITILGMSDKETFYLTKAMQASGKTFKFDFVGVDKHSTGGVGDSTTFVIVPVLASLGLTVTKMSGKSLGFTGGTVDKLACFEGYNTEMPEDKFVEILHKCGCGLISQSSKIAVADRKIYALRDKTATVDSVPLIASSIMSKKLASGSDVILLDVKYGSGAFMKDISDARKLARLMVKIGKADGKNIAAAVTNMNVPLSRGIGCGLEVYSALKCLHGDNCTLLELSKYLAAKLYSMATGTAYNESMKLVTDSISSGKALAKFKEMVTLFGGDTAVIDNPDKLLVSEFVTTVEVPCSGYINYVDAYKVAKFVNHLKARAESDNQKRRSGVLFNYVLGDKVTKGDTLVNIYSSVKITPEDIAELIDAIEITDKYTYKYKLVEDTVK